jgi:hypothetical protein
MCNRRRASRTADATPSRPLGAKIAPAAAMTTAAGLMLGVFIVMLTFVSGSARWIDVVT